MTLKRVTLAAAIAAFVAFAGVAYVLRFANATVEHLLEARNALASSEGIPTPHELEGARRNLRDVLRSFERPHWRVASALPLLGSNVAATTEIARGLDRLLADAIVVARKIQGLQETGLVEARRVRVDLISELGGPLKELAENLTDFRRRLSQQHTSGLLPAVSDVLEELMGASGTAGRRTGKLVELVRLSRSLAGDESERRYLVLLLNNAELRGAGGIPSAIGTVHAENARLRLGRFYQLHELRGGRPYQRVPAPGDFKERFGPYLSDTSFWVNTTMSADVPDVAVVAARLFRASTGVETDGVFLVDPRGLAALLPPDRTLTVPGTERKLKPVQLPDYVYWHVYEELGGANPRRKQALLGLGRRAFKAIIRGGVSLDLPRIGAAVAGGHVRFVPADQKERAVLSDLGVSGELPHGGGDSVVVIGQNFGGDKLDYWARGRVEHTCRVTVREALCETTSTVTNRVRQELPDFIAQPGHFPGAPYGLLRRFIEVFVPAHGRVIDVEIDGRPDDIYRSEEDGHTVIGADLEVLPGQSSRVVVRYELPLPRPRYSLVIAPQPLTHDVDLEVELRLPVGWSVRGHPLTGVPFRHEGPLDHILELRAGPI